MISYTEKTIARFWAKVDKTSDPNGCWLWSASTKNGYGQFTISRALPARYAHRIAWELMHGEIPPDMLCIREQYARGVYQVSLSAQFGVTQAQISRIVRGESWKGLDS